jgi:hypothetical protein
LAMSSKAYEYVSNGAANRDAVVPGGMGLLLPRLPHGVLISSVTFSAVQSMIRDDLILRKKVLKEVLK